MDRLTPLFPYLLLLAVSEVLFFLMNKKLEEFGEDRLCEVIQQYSPKTAREVLDGISKGMSAFAGKANQHDDRTIVVVNVT